MTLIGSSNSTCMATSKICREIENMEATGTVPELHTSNEVWGRQTLQPTASSSSVDTADGSYHHALGPHSYLTGPASQRYLFRARGCGRFSSTVKRAYAPMQWHGGTTSALNVNQGCDRVSRTKVRMGNRTEDGKIRYFVRKPVSYKVEGIQL